MADITSKAREIVGILNILDEPCDKGAVEAEFEVNLPSQQSFIEKLSRLDNA